MLNSIYFDGFKNLKDIELMLKPGLNVLVGSNGSGKSNILRALEFTSYLFKYNLNDIPKQMRVKNANELFWIPNYSDLENIGTNTFASESIESKIMTIAISGTNADFVSNTKTKVTDIGDLEENFIQLLVNYDYQCKIGFLPLDQKPLIYLNQSVKLIFEIGVKSKLGRSIIELKYDGVEPKLKSADIVALKENTDLPVNQFLRMLKNIPLGRLVDESLLTVMSEEFFPITNILADTDFGEAYDISTDLIRYDQQVFEPKNFAYDGKGLYSTLVYLKKFRTELFDEIIEDFKLISPFLFGFEVPDPKLGQNFNIYVKVKQNLHSDLYSSIPIELLSDGILKWFALVLAVNLSDNYLIFDEPDIHLDTDMHEDLAELLRNVLNQFDRIGIITTHNETLVNIIKPEELLVLDSDSGELSVNRIESKELSRLVSDMKKTNFKLGWYFNTGAIKLYCTETETINGDNND